MKKKRKHYYVLKIWSKFTSLYYEIKKDTYFEAITFKDTFDEHREHWRTLLSIR